jgi:hypothetical protein
MATVNGRKFSVWQSSIFDRHETHSPFVFAGLWEGWKVPLNDEWLDDIQRDKHSPNSHEHFTEPNWDIAHFCMKR